MKPRTQTRLRPPAAQLALGWWLALCTVFGAITGPLASAAVNHWQPAASFLLAGPIAVFFGLVFHWCVVVLDHRPWRQAAARVAAVLFFGSTLFMLPQEATLPAAGHAFAPSVLLRYALYCLPYPLVAAFFHSGTSRLMSGITAVCTAVALVLVWPALQESMGRLAASDVRSTLGVPADMLLAIDPPSAAPAGGYSMDDGAVVIGYGVQGGLMPDESDDLDLTVYPAGAANPCTDPRFQAPVDAPTCRQVGTDRWDMQSYQGASDYDGIVEVYHGLYVELQAGQDAADYSIPGSALPGILATLHPASDAELAASGVSGIEF